MLASSVAFAQYFDTDGLPLDGGLIYFGLPNQNPETNPIQIFLDAQGLNPIAQPVQTINGYTSVGGSARMIFLDGNSGYSCTVRNRRGELVWSQASLVGALDPAALISQIDESVDAASGYADAASDSAAAAAASAAVAQANAAYTTVSIGLAATTNGQFFPVRHADGYAADIYLNSAGVAVYQSTVPYGPGLAIAQTQALENSSSIVTQYPVDPYVVIEGIDSFFTDGQGTPAHGGSTIPTDIYQFGVSDIRFAQNPNVMVTRNYADGPAGPMTAARAQFANSIGACQLWTSALGRPPAGTYIARMKIASTPGAGSQAIRIYSPATPPLVVNATAVEGTFADVDFPFTTNGTDYPLVQLGGNGSNTIDVLVGGIQLREGVAANLPAITAEMFPSSFTRATAWKGSQVKVGKLFDNTAGLGGILRLVGWPTLKTFTEMTVIVAFQNDIASPFGPVICADFDPVLATQFNVFNISVGSTGQLAAQPLVLNTLGTPYVLGEGLQIVGLRLKNGARSFHYHEIEMQSDAGAFSPLSARNMRIGSTVGAVQTEAITNSMKGKIALVFLHDAYLSKTAYQQAVRAIRDRVSFWGEDITNFRNVVLFEGDSNTANPFLDSKGPSYAYQLMDPSQFSPNLVGKNLAVNGSTIAIMTARLPALIATIKEAAMNGRNVIVCAALSGVNDATFIINNGYAAYYAQVLAYNNAVRAAGAKLITGSLLPNAVAGAAFDTQRDLYNAFVKTQTSDWDGFMDTASDSNIGPNGIAMPGTYAYDDRHLNGAGQTIWMGIAKPIIQSLMV